MSETDVLGDFWGRIKGAKYRFVVMDREAWRAVIHGAAELDMTELLD